MSKYRAGDIIKLTRISVGVTQEELSDDICSVETLSRIENGKHGVKKTTYQSLMERMGRRPDKSYSILTLRDFNVMDDMEITSTCLNKYDFAKAEASFEKVVSELEDTDTNNQYEQRIRALLDYYQNRISEYDFLEKLEYAISITVPDYKKFLEKVYPFTDSEISLMMNIATAYANLEKYEEAIKIIDMLLRCLDLGYMSKRDSVPYVILLLNNKARYYGGLDQYSKAIEIAEEALKMARKEKWRSSFPNLFLELAWNMIQQIEAGDREKEDLPLCKKYLRQGYAYAADIKKNSIKNTIRDYYKEYFKEDIYFSSISSLGEMNV